MTRPWYVRNPEVYEDVRSQIEDKYPDLSCILENGKALVRGYYPICEDGQVLDRYMIELILPEDSLRGLPTLYETAGRIERDVTHHMGKDGAACVVLPDAFWYDHPGGMTPLEFLDGPVCSYFASQSLVERGQPSAWPVGQWEHGVAGIVEFYGELLETTDRSVILAFLERLKAEVVRGHWSCPCGSGNRIRDCHLQRILEVRQKIPRQVAALSAAALGSHR